MVIKHSFQFLNTFSFSLKNKVMFLVRQSYKIARAIVMFNPIKVMNYPTIRQRFPVNLFPYKKMLSNIAISICSRMLWAQYKNIPIFLSIDSTSPIMMSLASFNQLRYLSFVPSSPLLTTLTSLSLKSFKELTTIYTNLRWDFTSLNVAIKAKFRPSVYQLPTIRARMPMPLFISFIDFARGFAYISSIALFGEYINLYGFELRQEMPW